nr:uncharacterized protein LOC100175578 [Ciona intestinalis]|eukprot:XP_026692487.1 uncharacterized protein LOC100175578 [Ciona intestinalis]
MKFTVDHFKRLSVSDLRSFEQSMSMWFRARDSQKNLVNALGLAKVDCPTLNRRLRVPEISERHSSVVLNCTPPRVKLSQAVREMSPAKSKSVTSGELLKFWQKFQISTPKKETLSTKSKPCAKPTRPVTQCKKRLEPQTTVKVSPSPQTQVVHSRLQCPLSSSINLNNRTAARNCIDLNSNSVTKPRFQPRPSPTRKQNRPMSLRKMVTLREHRKKCEERVRELEAQSRRLRRKKADKSVKL